MGNFITSLFTSEKYCSCMPSHECKNPKDCQLHKNSLITWGIEIHNNQNPETLTSLKITSSNKKKDTWIHLIKFCEECKKNFCEKQLISFDPNWKINFINYDN